MDVYVSARGGDVFAICIWNTAFGIFFFRKRTQEKKHMNQCLLSAYNERSACSRHNKNSDQIRGKKTDQQHCQLPVALSHPKGGGGARVIRNSQ
jgi:hypothetical protein